MSVLVDMIMNGMKKTHRAVNYAHLPNTPGVYFMKGWKGEILYIGKAGNLRRRVGNYFSRAHDVRIEQLMQNVRSIAYIETQSALEALIKEAELIKKYSPPYNVKEKDNKSFLYAEITKEAFPRVLLVRGAELVRGMCFGPFTNASQLRQALKIIRKIFPFNTHALERVGKSVRPCLDYELGLCPGTCVGRISKTKYRNTIRNITQFFNGEKKSIVKAFRMQMKLASKELRFEDANELKRKIFALTHIKDVAFLSDLKLEASVSSIDGQNSKYANEVRIEGYDISNISGAFATGSMVVFYGDEATKGEYRKFKIRSFGTPNDIGMLREVFERRFSRVDWPLPHIVFVDGGKPQVNTARTVLLEKGFRIPVIGIAKGPMRKKIEFVGNSLAQIAGLGIAPKTLVRVRDEAHRFAISYHRAVRRKRFLSSFCRK